MISAAFAIWLLAVGCTYQRMFTSNRTPERFVPIVQGIDVRMLLSVNEGYPL